MADWQGAKVTVKGQALLAKITAGRAKLDIPRIAFGSGKLTNIENATRLVQEIDDAEVITKVQKNNTCTVTVRMTNAKFSQGQNIAELGIFAIDPDEGEILFAAMIDARPDFVQAASSSTLVAKTVTMGIGYSNADNVTITLSNSMWITAEEVLSMISDELRKYSNNKHKINDSTLAVNTEQTVNILTDMIGNRIKAITGEVSWVGDPVNNIAGMNKSLTDLLKLITAIPIANIQDFNKNVISALDKEKLSVLGVKFNFDNPNAWSICFGRLFGNLIIQGGNLDFTKGYISTVTLPIKINSLLAPLALDVIGVNQNSAYDFTIAYYGPLSDNSKVSFISSDTNQGAAKYCVFCI